MVAVLAMMWGTSIVLWVDLSTKNMTRKELVVVIICSVLAILFTWASRSLFKEISLLKDEIFINKEKIRHLERMEKIAEGRSDRMVSLLRQKFHSEISEIRKPCNGQGCWEVEAYGSCSHGFYRKEVTILRVRTEDGKEIVLTPEKEDTVFNHIKDVPNVIDVDISFKVLESYEYKIE